LLSPWGPSAVLKSVLDGTQNKTYRIETSGSSASEVDDLAGIQVYYAQSVNKRLFVNGLRLADNKTVLIEFAADGTKVGESVTSGVKIIKMVNFSAE
jgi:hypothetical protein